jgi:hypothetical protein
MTYVSEGRRISRLIAGALLLLVGVLFVMQNLGLLRAGTFGDYWPLFLVWIGLTRMLGPARARHFASGLVIFLLGVFFQLDRLDVIWVPMHRFWPLLLIAIGFGLIADSLIGRRSAGTGVAPSSHAGPGGGA